MPTEADGELHFPPATQNGAQSSSVVRCADAIIVIASTVVGQESSTLKRAGRRNAHVPLYRPAARRDDWLQGGHPIETLRTRGGRSRVAVGRGGCVSAAGGG
ncbi:unnamed protein product [Lampetra planeri]